MEAYYPYSALVLALLVWLVFLVQSGRAMGRIRRWSPEKRSRKLVLLALLSLAWMVVVAWAALLGFFCAGEYWLFRFLAMVLPFAILAGFYVLGGSADLVVKRYPTSGLLLLQGFRLLMGLLVEYQVRQGQLPQQMGMGGYNYEVFAGGLGLLLGLVLLVFRFEKLLLALYNLLGLASLLAFYGALLFSLPGDFRLLMGNPAPSHLCNFPEVFLAGVLVTQALILHFLLLRRLKWAE